MTTTDVTEQHPGFSGLFDLQRVAGRIGAEIRGVDLADELDATTVDAVAEALVAHKVLFFPGQRLDPDTHLAFAQRLGTPTLAHPTVPSLPGHRNVFELDAHAGARANVWHTDVTFVHRPPSASVLNSVIIPPVGGDTIWANTATAYLDLPADLRARADELWARHSNTADYGGIGGITTAGNEYSSAFASTRFVARHPVVRVHPVSGERSLLLGGFARSIEGVSDNESKELLRTFKTYVTKPENTVRWRWTVGDVVIWDNRATQHYAIDDFGEEPRRVQRITLVGEAARSIDGASSEQLDGDPDAYLTLA